MLERENPIDALISHPDNELRRTLKKWDFPYWVSEYVDYVLAWDGNEAWDYLPIWDWEYESILLSSRSNRRFAGKGAWRQKYH